MRIKSIELIGFKSFYNKTRLELSNGINAIVGPNGCGKSNVIDAMRWVLGEQNPRILRADSMEELIATGTDVLQPLGMAEVSLVVENLPGIGFEELNIRRRYYRSGESEFSINGVNCRLKDITELFLDTGAGARGYSIIGQGKVEEFITAKPEEKRRLIEEVAGVVKYKTRRKETRSRIDSTRENLSRVQDMKNEVFRQMENLSRQAEEADEYKKLTERLKLLELNILRVRLNKLDEENNALTDKKAKLNSSVSELSGQKEQKNRALMESENAGNRLNEEINRIETEIYSLKSEINEKVSYQEYVLKEAAGIDEYINKLKKEISSIESEKDEIRETVNNKKSYLERNLEEKSKISTGLENLEKELEKLREESRNNKNELDSTKSVLFDILNSLSNVKGSAVGIGKELEELNSRRDRVNEDIEKIFLIIEGSRDTLNRLNNELEEIKNERGCFEENMGNLENTMLSSKELFERKSEKNIKTRERLNETVSRLEVLNDVQSKYEWLPEATRDFLVNNKIEGVLGVVSDFIQAPENYEKALEAALGEKSNWVVVKDNNDALTAIDLLRESSKGRGTFLPLGCSPRDTENTISGFQHTKISDLITVEGVDRGIIDTMLESVYVVNTLDEAIRLKADMGGNVSVATIDGSFVDSSGAITGGHTTGGVFERKREIEMLSESSKQLGAEAAEIKEQLDSLSMDIEKNKSEIENLDKVLREKEIRMVELEKDISNLNRTIEETAERKRAREAELDAINEQVNAKNLQVAEHNDTVSKLESEKEDLDQRFSQFEDIVKNYESREKLIEQDITGLKVKAASIAETERLVEKEISGLLERDGRLSGKIINEKEEIALKEKDKEELMSSSVASKEQAEMLSQKLLFKDKELSDVKNKREESAVSLTGSRQLVANLDEEIIKLKDDLASTEIKLNSVSLEIGHINEQMEKITGEGGTDKRLSDDELNKFDLEDSTREYNKLKKRVDSFGLVNLLAPEEYKKLKERHNFLTEQTEDLESALASLIKAINKLDRESVTRFKEAFEQINTKFQEIIGKLFAGGEGKLVITEPEDLLNTGIEVLVKPGGKKLQSISLLSGGEKALSAIALIMSACLVKPVPFLLLDEIDAPLDESNTARFSKLVKEIADDSQVVIITHNKSTMVGVDTLVGVTAGKSVASKVVSVELNAA